MYIFYDFETSSRESLGQILSYAFVVTDSTYDVIDTLSGKIRLNRTQCPEVQAILTNRLDITELQASGEPEYLAAERLFTFLNGCCERYGTCTLVGFNSNQFDLTFLRNTLIRYGYNPYFRGKLKNLDILHWAQYLGFYFPEKFPWVLQQNEADNKQFYSFKLEDLAHSCGLLSEAQTHDAMDDVMLTIALLRHFETLCGAAFSEFQPCVFPENMNTAMLLKLKRRHFCGLNDAVRKHTWDYVVCVSANPKLLLFIDLSRLMEKGDLALLSDDEKLACMKYVNTNKQFFITESCNEAEEHLFGDFIASLWKDPLFTSLKQDPSSYFSLTPKNWDIEYQIHELGFERIDTLGKLRQELLANPDSYTSNLQKLLQSRTSQKDNYLIQLFNRMYLNIHESPDPSLLQRYLKPRYIDKTLYRNPDDCSSFKEQAHELATSLESCPDQDRSILEALHDYYETFRSQFAELVT